MGDHSRDLFPDLFRILTERLMEEQRELDDRTLLLPPSFTVTNYFEFHAETYFAIDTLFEAHGRHVIRSRWREGLLTHERMIAACVRLI
ncbi:hypothetical protein Hypma_005197 [Hypsizygus marmoreus]|uniref:Uncharacterized protein n=1 Tax=Hypsizygus marmoreus TaxID=39966 RepID=A0A369J6L2_HYPMA|nr:hypothetical protein Hypma_005197 [Hypsizygus marmoreus]